MIAIIATIGAMGFGGLTMLRNNIILNQATNSVVSFIRLSQNRARNGAVSEARFATNGGVIPLARADAFALYFDSTSVISVRYCTRSVAAGNVSYNCNALEAPVPVSYFVPFGFDEIRIQPVDTGVCRGILFPRLTGDLSGITALTDEPIDSGTCVIRVTHTSLGSSKDISINLADNNVEIE